MKQGHFLYAIALWLLWTACESPAAREERLARTYCGSCHQFPEPRLLDKTTWNDFIFPQMAFRMGLDASLITSIPENDLPFVLPTLPERPMVTEEEWAAIKNYFLTQARDSLSTSQPSADTIRQFDVTAVKLPQNTFPLLTLLKADTATRSFYTSNRHGLLHRFDYQFNLLDSTKLLSAISNVIKTQGGDLIATQLGIMDPNDQPRGSLLSIRAGREEMIVDSLTRPVFTEQSDLNKDGQLDLVVCEFGNYTGALTVFQKLGDGQYRRHLINNLPGARRVEVRDFNNDGLNDILVQFTQGNEQITLFTNAGNFQFRVLTLLQFPPVYGSSYFETADFNGDGHFDLLYANGDNADYSITLKPYHGIRIFLNDGKNQFSESSFLPMHGCSQAMARDFDKDGDLDIAAISFFPHFAQTPERGFLYFENRNGTFIPFMTPLGAKGRWLVMEVMDADGDKDEDIIIGALDFNNGTPPRLLSAWKSDPVSLLFFRNKLVP